MEYSLVYNRINTSTQLILSHGVVWRLLIHHHYHLQHCLSDVPPLEDMSEVLQSIAELRGEQNTEKIKSTYLEATENVEEAKLRSVQKLLFKDGKGHPGQSAPIAKEISSKPDPKVNLFLG